MSAGNPDQKVYVYAVFFFPDQFVVGCSDWRLDNLSRHTGTLVGKFGKRPLSPNPTSDCSLHFVLLEGEP